MAQSYKPQKFATVADPSAPSYYHQPAPQQQQSRGSSRGGHHHKPEYPHPQPTQSWYQSSGGHPSWRQSGQQYSASNQASHNNPAYNGTPAAPYFRDYTQPQEAAPLPPAYGASSSQYYATYPPAATSPVPPIAGQNSSRLPAGNIYTRDRYGNPHAGAVYDAAAPGAGYGPQHYVSPQVAPYPDPIPYPPHPVLAYGAPPPPQHTQHNVYRQESHFNRNGRARRPSDWNPRPRQTQNYSNASKTHHSTRPSHPTGTRGGGHGENGAPRADAAVTSKRKRRKANALGLTPADDEESGGEDEEGKLAKTVELSGFSGPVDINAYIAERKKKYPRREAQKAAELANKKTEESVATVKESAELSALRKEEEKLCAQLEAVQRSMKRKREEEIGDGDMQAPDMLPSKTVDGESGPEALTSRKSARKKRVDGTQPVQRPMKKRKREGEDESDLQSSGAGAGASPSQTNGGESGLEAGRPPKPADKPPVRKVKANPNDPCKYYAFGANCGKGIKCRFKHDPDERAANIAAAQAKNSSQNLGQKLQSNEKDKLDYVVLNSIDLLNSKGVDTTTSKGKVKDQDENGHGQSAPNGIPVVATVSGESSLPAKPPAPAGKPHVRNASLLGQTPFPLVSNPARRYQGWKPKVYGGGSDDLP